MSLRSSFPLILDHGRLGDFFWHGLISNWRRGRSRSLHAIFSTIEVNLRLDDFRFPVPVNNFLDDFLHDFFNFHRHFLTKERGMESKSVWVGIIIAVLFVRKQPFYSQVCNHSGLQPQHGSKTFLALHYFISNISTLVTTTSLFTSTIFSTGTSFITCALIWNQIGGVDPLACNRSRCVCA